MTIELVKELRARTHISLGECKSALEEANNDLDKAMVVLQKRGTIRAGAVASRPTGEGKIFTYVHGPGKMAVIVEVNCETDFAAKAPLLLEFGEHLAMHIAAFNPVYTKSTDIPDDVKLAQTEIFYEQCSDKPEAARPKIAEGKMAKWFTEVCLMDQAWINNNKKSVEQARSELVAALGENITIRRYSKWQVGE